MDFSQYTLNELDTLQYEINQEIQKKWRLQNAQAELERLQREVAEASGEIPEESVADEPVEGNEPIPEQE